MGKLREYELEVHQLREGDVFKSIIRIDREVVDALGLSLHGLCKVRSTEKRQPIYVQVRSNEDKDPDSIGSAEERILMDEELRNRLGVKERRLYRFAFRSIRRRNVLGNLACLGSHEDPVVRITFWLALFSVAVGALLVFVPTLV